MDSVDVITGFLTGGAIYLFAFILVIGVVISVHEFGHFQMGRWCGARIEMFSIGFGRPIVKWTDRKGTVWKIGWLPLGGFVKFWGDEDAISMTRQERLEAIKNDPAARQCFHFKPLWQRALIIVAGPAINFVFAVIVFAAVFASIGYLKVEPRLGEVLAGSAAEGAGIRAGDVISAIDGEPVDNFYDLVSAVQTSDGESLRIDIVRDGKVLSFTVFPTRGPVDDGFGHKVEGYRLGAALAPDAKRERIPQGPIEALKQGGHQVYFIVERTFAFIGGLIAGREDPKLVSGPIGIGEKAGQAIQIGWLTLILLMAGVSVSVGLVNLFPIPMLDGGHLLFYAYEAVFRRPLNERAQEYGLRIGVALVLSLMLFATWNDLSRIFGS